MEERRRKRDEQAAARDRNPAGTSGRGLDNDAGAFGRTEQMTGSGRVQEIPGFSGTGQTGSQAARTRHGIDDPQAAREPVETGGRKRRVGDAAPGGRLADPGDEEP